MKQENLTVQSLMMPSDILDFLESVPEGKQKNIISARVCYSGFYKNFKPIVFLLNSPHDALFAKRPNWSSPKNQTMNFNHVYQPNGQTNIDFKKVVLSPDRCAEKNGIKITYRKIDRVIFKFGDTAYRFSCEGFNDGLLHLISVNNKKRKVQTKEQLEYLIGTHFNWCGVCQCFLENVPFQPKKSVCKIVQLEDIND